MISNISKCDVCDEGSVDSVEKGNSSLPKASLFAAAFCSEHVGFPTENYWDDQPSTVVVQYFPVGRCKIVCKSRMKLSIKLTLRFTFIIAFFVWWYFDHSVRPRPQSIPLNRK